MTGLRLAAVMAVAGAVGGVIAAAWVVLLADTAEKVGDL